MQSASAKWQAILDRGLPGTEARRPWSPRLAYGRHFHRPRDPETRRAAVALLVYPVDDQWHLALTLRCAAMAHHAGQVSLPGGTVEADEESDAAMRRELAEELGVVTTPQQCVGSLSPLHVFNSRFWVQPWLVALAQRPVFTPAPDEVEELLEYPLERLRTADPSQRCRIERWGTSWSAPCMRWGHHEIWGATSLILAEFQALIAAGLPSTAVDT